VGITLLTYPVTVSSGKTRNIFAGFAPVEITLKREDTAIVGISQGVGNKVLISITGDISSNLQVGEWVYVYSEGTNFTYDGVYQILTVAYSSPNTAITVDYDYIENGTSGYCNYKQNWFLESKLVNEDNNDILQYPQLLQTDGNPNGNIEINVSMLVDFLTNEIKTTSQEITNSRKKCKVMYREVWRENATNSFTLINQITIIIIYAAENFEIESFINNFEIPKIWDGYPFWLNLLHSDLNEVEKRISVSFDELDINQANIITANALTIFNYEDHGILQVNLSDNQKVIETNTRFIRFNADSEGSGGGGGGGGTGDFKAGDFKTGDFFTG
jgi:hypothetical protein